MFWREGIPPAYGENMIKIDTAPTTGTMGTVSKMDTEGPTLIKLPGVMDLRPDGLVSDQNISGLTMDNVNWSNGRINDVNLIDGRISKSNLSGLVIENSCEIRDAVVHGFPLVEMLKLWQEHHG